MERQDSPTSSTPANSKTFVVKEGKKMEVSSPPIALMDSELTTCSQSMIVEDPGESTTNVSTTNVSTTNVSMETNVNSNSISRSIEEEQ